MSSIFKKVNNFFFGNEYVFKEFNDVQEKNKPSIYATNEHIIFHFGEQNLLNPGFEKVNEQMDSSSWLKTIIENKIMDVDYDENGEIIKKNSEFDQTDVQPNDVKLLSDSTIQEKYDFSHAGLIQYVFTAWAKELGVVLRPDMFLFTIVSEIKRIVYQDPKKFRDSFTISNEKQTILIFDLTIEKLINVLESMIPNKKIFDVFTKTQFNSAPQNFNTAMAITLCDMIAPYYLFMDTDCGIPAVMIKGDKSEWQHLVSQVDVLLNEFEQNRVLRHYLDTAKSTLNAIIHSVFSGDGAFLNDIFSYKKRVCVSGHPIIIDGWIRDFYVTPKKSYIHQYPSHLSCLPYAKKNDLNDPKYYFHISGLSTSKTIDGFLHPDYSIIHGEIKGDNAQKIFDTIAKN
jgi:hypothetical protein